MKFDPAKTYPHPVLRPGSSDYPGAEFQVDIKLDRLSGGTELRMTADFHLSDPDLLGLVESDGARYVLHVLAPKIHFRTVLDSSDPSVDSVFPEGRLHGHVVLSPFLICTRHVAGLSIAGWHDDYAALSFDVAPGAVLAQDTPKEYWVDTAEETPVGSIFSVRVSHDRDLKTGMWRCYLHEDKVVIQMPAEDHQRFLSARNRVNRTADAQYLMNGLYLPALVWVLQEADRNEESYAGYRWYRALQAQLGVADCSPLGDEHADRLLDAQRLLQLPFARMPLMVDGVDGGADEEASGVR